MSDSQGVDVQKWQDLGMECGSVREPWSQSFGLRSDIPGEVRRREKGKEKKNLPRSSSWGILMAGRQELDKAGKDTEEVSSLARSGLGRHPRAGTSRGQLERLSDKPQQERCTVGSTQCRCSWM